MTGSQYKNVAQWTLANTAGVETMDSANTARAIFNNLGVAFPNGSCEEILLTLMSEDYMGWTPCTYRQAQEYANAGVAAVGVDTSRVVVILPDGSADSVIASADAAVVFTSAKQTSDIAATERMGMQFYAYAASATTTITPEPKKLFPVPGGEYGDPFHCTCSTHNGKHNGIDIKCGGISMPIVASETGIVREKVYSSSYGYVVTVSYGEYLALYAHMKEHSNRSVNEQVKAGDQIGMTGNTGDSFGVHLHLGIGKNVPNNSYSNICSNKYWINPKEWLNS